VLLRKEWDRTEIAVDVLTHSRGTAHDPDSGTIVLKQPETDWFRCEMSKKTWFAMELGTKLDRAPADHGKAMSSSPPAGMGMREGGFRCMFRWLARMWGFRNDFDGSTQFEAGADTAVQRGQGGIHMSGRW